MVVVEGAGACRENRRYLDRADEGCSFMDANRFCTYAYMNKVGRIDKEGARKMEGVETRVSGKRLNEEIGGETGVMGKRNG